MEMTEHFPWPPKNVVHEFLFKSHEKQSNAAGKGDFAGSWNWSTLKISF